MTGRSTVLEPPRPITLEEKSIAGAKPSGPTRIARSTKPFRPVLALTVVLFAYTSITQGSFLTVDNLQNVLVSVSVLWVVALGQTFALLTGGADLASGAIASVVAVFMAKVIGSLPDGVTVLLALGFGTLVGGLANGLLIGYMRLSFFVVTLATGTALTGVVQLWTNGQSYLFNHSLVNWLALERHLGVAGPIWIMAVTFAVAYYVQRYTYFGRNVYAAGGSAPAARLSGIRVERTLLAVFAVCGFCAALGGVLAAGLVNAVDANIDNTLALQAIAAVLVGGTSLYGGSGSVVGTAFGVLFIGVLQNSLDLAGIASAWQYVVTGLILVVAVAATPGAPQGRRSLLTEMRRRLRRSEPETGAEPPV